MIALNEEEVIFGRFPNGEINLPVAGLKIEPLVNLVKLVYDDDSEFFKLALLKSWLDDMMAPARLYLTYMPHSRMDRPNGHFAVSLKTACDLVNAMGFKEVVVREPHSKITLDLLENATADEWCSRHLPWVLSEGFDSLFFPDFGAKQRYGHLVSELPKAYGKKSRDFLTGEIQGLAVRGEIGARVLIVDDLCSRGGTFSAAADQLIRGGAKSVCLLVAYVEDNVFTGNLFDCIDRIYTSSERFLRNHPRIIKLG